MKFLDLLKEKIVVFDGAMGTNLMAQNLTLDDFGGANFENCSENLISRAKTIPTAPFYGSKVVHIQDLTKVFAFINETALFKGQWQYK
ncbi:MAG: hypothetical protein ACR2L1_11600 [Pyrinomonadaceae bacterium]